MEPCHPCFYPKSFPVPQYSPVNQPMLSASQTAEVTLSTSSWSFLFSFFSLLLSLLQNEETKLFFMCKVIPNGSCGCCCEWLSGELKTKSRPIEGGAKELPEGAPALKTKPVPQSQPKLQAQPQAEKEGCLQALPGGWTDGKELAGTPRKANLLQKLLYEGLASEQTAKKGGDRTEESTKI